MKVSRLLEQLNEEITEKTLKRDDLLTKMLAADTELRELDGQRDIVTTLVARFASGESRVNNPVQLEGTPLPVPKNLPQKVLQVSWPIEPHYQKQFDVKKRQAWALYKLGTADWYLSTLHQIMKNIEKLDRFLGVEMVIDGALQALCATFDAAVFAVLDTLEGRAQLPSNERTPAHLVSWDALIEQAERFGADLVSASTVFEALVADDPANPQGWLAQLLLLRHISTQHDLIIRHWHVGGDVAAACIDVPGKGPQPPLEYLTEARSLVEQLLKAMVNDQERLSQKHIIFINGHKSHTERALPDLLHRAGVTSRG